MSNKKRKFQDKILNCMFKNIFFVNNNYYKKFVTGGKAYDGGKR